MGASPTGAIRVPGALFLRSVSRLTFDFLVSSQCEIFGRALFSRNARPPDPTVADGYRAAGVDALQWDENKAETKSNRR
jgi:hypothetical protein